MNENVDEPIEYTIKPGDTLQSIALMFDIPLLFLKQTNQNIYSVDIVPGDVIKIVHPTAAQKRLDPIDSQIFNKKKAIDGALIILDDYIRFEPRKSKYKPLMLNLVGFISTKIDPHPCEIDALPDEMLSEDSLALLTVNILTDPGKSSSYETFVFTGRLKELQEFQVTMESRASSAKRKKHYVQPSIAALSEPHPKNRTRSNASAPKLAFKENESTVLPYNESAELRGSLPRRFQIDDWHLRYRLSLDGTSMTAFIQKTRSMKASVLLIKTSTGDIIGAFMSNGILGSQISFTSGETFVFSYTPSFEKYQWARTIQYLISVDDNGIIIGGCGAAAIWIDCHLLNAFSEKCSAFNSPPLATKIQFKIIDLEMWEIGGRK